MDHLVKKTLTTGSFLILLLFANNAISQNIYLANTQRIEARIKELATYGSKTPGVLKRVAYSKGDIEARKYIITLMRSSGLSVIIDPAGNIIGRRKGRNSAMPYISFGSHIDAVPSGGIYDGDLGVVGAIECIDLLNQNHIETDHPLEVIVFTDEEGYLTGSKAMVGDFQKTELDVVTNSGKTTREGINDIGGNSGRINIAKRDRKDIKTFLELHIEQSDVLESENLNIGIVDSIVGKNPFNITIEGMANHAGTTPMKLRKDALLTAAKIIVAVNEVALSFKGRQVATVGKITASPGASNVIAGKVVMTLDIRDISEEKLKLIFNAIKQKADSVALLNSTIVTFTSTGYNKPAKTDARIQALIAESVKDLNLSSNHLTSGALHDSQDMAKLWPVGMIFVPSKNGISHSPDEYTSPRDMANGVNVLFKTILKIDKAPF